MYPQAHWAGDGKPASRLAARTMRGTRRVVGFAPMPVIMSAVAYARQQTFGQAKRKSVMR